MSLTLLALIRLSLNDALELEPFGRPSRWFGSFSAVKTMDAFAVLTFAVRSATICPARITGVQGVRRGVHRAVTTIRDDRAPWHHVGLAGHGEVVAVAGVRPTVESTDTSQTQRLARFIASEEQLDALAAAEVSSEVVK